MSNPLRLCPIILLLGAIIAVVANGAIATAACVNGYPSVASEYKRSEVVITARVLNAKLVPSANDGYFLDGTIYGVEMRKGYKGNPGDALSVFSENSSGRFPMQIGREYLLFLYRDHGRYQVDNCGNSDELPKSLKKVAEVERIAAGRRIRR